MSRFDHMEGMIATVAKALGPELCQQVVFVGGCTTALHVTDPVTLGQIRYTDDVDLIIHVLGYAGWYQFQQQLEQRGFTVHMQDTVNCRMRLNNLIVDFMPDDAAVLGFSNRWYRDAYLIAPQHVLTDGTPIRLISPPYFVATKLEAWRGRGRGDVLTSRDVEDIVTLFDGRSSLPAEIATTDPALQLYIAEELAQLLRSPDFLYLLQSAATSPERYHWLSRQIKSAVIHVSAPH